MSSETDSHIVTIDGPAGSGKSTVAWLLAHKLNVDFLDTGAMYRGIAAYVLDHDVAPTDSDAVVRFAESLDIRFIWAEDPPVLTVNGERLVERLRDADVTAMVSVIAAISGVRDILVNVQRRIGREHPYLVTEGRDQGSVVFPDALAKFYLDASPEVRARRRADQLIAKGKVVDEAAILDEIRARDERDRSRANSPLVIPDDATHVDTSHLTIDEVVDRLAGIVRDRQAEPVLAAT